MSEHEKTEDQTTEATEAERAATAADAARDAEAAPEPSDPVRAELDAVIAERDALRDKLMRALAEAENIRKRAERDRKDAETYGGTRLARDIVEVCDNLDRALGAADDAAREGAAALIEGVELTRRELLQAFAKHKIEPIAPEVGEKFDPKLHQAMFEAPVANAPAGSIIQVMQQGFTIAGRLLRPAMVGVASAQSADAAKAPNDAEATTPAEDG